MAFHREQSAIISRVFSDEYPDFEPAEIWEAVDNIPIPDTEKVKSWRMDKWVAAALTDPLSGNVTPYAEWVYKACTSIWSGVIPGRESSNGVPWMTGHRYDTIQRVTNDMLGPCKGIKLMIILPNPEREDGPGSRHLRSNTIGVGGLVREAVGELDLTDNEHEIYITSVSRFPTPFGDAKQKDRWYKAGYALVAAEAMAVNPDVIICMGAPAVKALWGKAAKVTDMRGSLHRWYNSQVIATVSPTQFLSGHAGRDEWIADMRWARELAFGKQVGISEHVTEMFDASKYQVIIEAGAFDAQVDYILAQKPWLLVFDCEWGNDYGREEFGYTISCQVSWGPHTGCYFQLRQAGTGAVVHTEDEFKQCVRALKRLLMDSPAMIGGHNLPVDVSELYHLDEEHTINLREKMKIGYDSMVIHHLLHQDDDQGLEVLVRKFCPEVGAYWQDLEAMLDTQVTRQDASRSENLRHGYRDIPEHILIPYALLDADATYRCIDGLIAEWSGPHYQKLRDLYTHIVQPASDALLEIKLNGLRMDAERMGQIQVLFKDKHDELLNELREITQWGDSFNPNSPYQVAVMLFAGTVYKDCHVHLASKPAAGRTYGFTPLSNTDKYPKQWDVVVEDGLAAFSSPSTKAESLKILMNGLNVQISELQDDADAGNQEAIAQVADLTEAQIVAGYIHDIKILSQFLKSFLKLPTISPEQQAVLDSQAALVGCDIDTLVERIGRQAVADRYGLVTHKGRGIIVEEDGNSFRERMSQKTGRVSGTLLPTTDTGRCRMFKANLQVFPKKQESEVKRIFGRDIDKVKYCVIPQDRIPGEDGDGEDWVVTEADFKQAESWIMAISSLDLEMLKILVGGRDLHSENCYKSFGLDMPEHWGWNGDEPEDGQSCSLGDGFEFVRRVMPFDELLTEEGKRKNVWDGETVPPSGGGAVDYDVWAAVIKALYPGKRTAAKSISFGGYTPYCIHLEFDLYRKPDAV